MGLKASIQHLFRTLFTISILDSYTYLSRKLRYLGDEISLHHTQIGEMSYHIVLKFLFNSSSKLPLQTGSA